MVDTHIHIWDFNKAEYSWLEGNTTLLNRTYAIDELSALRKEAGITKGVLVQAANNAADTDWMLEVAAATDWIGGVVGWLPLMDPGASRHAWEKKYNDNTYLKGIRHLIHDEPDAEWLLQPAVLESLNWLAGTGLTYDIVGVQPAHIRTALKVAEQVPGLKMVFDHLNQPPAINSTGYAEWQELMQAAAQHENLYAKISGLGTASGKGTAWTKEDIKPAVAFVLDSFGTERCFCGGDWPVSLLAGDYTHTWKNYKEVIEELCTADEAEKIFTANAVSFYHL